MTKAGARKQPMTAILYTTQETPVGPLLLAGDEQFLRLIRFACGSRARAPQPGWKASESAFHEVLRELRAYFRGELKRFSVPLILNGTEFQVRVWRELQNIPYGETISYRELAERIGNPRAVRAVGLANGANPIPIIVPCHRVIGSNGNLTGFGGGLDTKRKLLALESSQMTLP